MLHALLIVVASLVAEHRLSGASIIAACGLLVVAHRLSFCGLAAPQTVGSSWIRDGTCVSCFRRHIHYHRAIREAQMKILLVTNP